MRSESSLVCVAAGAIASFFLAAWIILTPDDVFAAEGPRTGNQAPVSQSNQMTPPMEPAATPPLDTLPKLLDEDDHVATLEAVHMALSEVGDGASYVWHRANGRLSGVIHPISSFKAGDGTVCRHVVIMLTTGQHTRRTKGVACRRDDGGWQLAG